jgi:hypothetical protein
VAVTFDAAGPSSSGAGSSSSASLSWSHTCGASASYLLAGVWQSSASDLAMTCTYNSVSMTSLGTIDGWTNASGNGLLQVWYMASPPTGSAYTVAVTVTGGTPVSLSGGSVSLSGGGSLGTPVLAQQWNTAPTAAISTGASTSLVAAFCGVNAGGTFTVTSPSVSRVLFNPGGSAMLSGVTSAGTGSSVTTAWTSTSAPWGIIAVEVRAGGGTGLPAYLRLIPQAVAVAATR